MQIKTKTRYQYTHFKMAQIKKQIIHHYGKNTEQFKLSYISGGNAKNGTATPQKQFGSFL